MTTRLFLVRHGQSEWNAIGRWQGQADPPLSGGGADESARAVEALAGFRGPVVSSDLRRAAQTANIVANALGLGAVALHEGLREIDVGEWCGLTHVEIDARFPGALDDWRAGRLERPPGGEDRASFRGRVLAALSAIAETHPGAEVLVVTHGGAIHTVERHLGIVEDTSVGNLGGRWFEMGREIRAASGRVSLLPAAGPTTILR